MGRWSKKIKPKESRFETVFHESRKKANAIDKETDDYVRGMLPELNHNATLIMMVNLSYFLHKHFNMGIKRFKVLNDWIKYLSDCVTTGLISYDELRANIIVGTDPAESPIKWTDYQYREKRMMTSLPTVDEAKHMSMRDFKQVLITQKKRDYVETICSALECLIIVQLHDKFGWGRQRLEKLVNMLRHSRHYDKNEFIEILEYLTKKKQIMFTNAEMQDTNKLWDSMEGVF